MGSSQGNINYSWRVEVDVAATHLGSFKVLETSSKEIHRKGDAVPAVSLLLPAVQAAREARTKSVSLKMGYIVTKDLQDWWRALTRREGTRKNLRITGSAGSRGASLKILLRGAIPTRLLGSVRDDNGATAASEPAETLVLNYEEIQFSY